MRPLRYSINLSIDGCYDHRVLPANEELHRRAAESLGRADALLFGRVTYEMMESAFNLAGPSSPEIDASDPFVTAINAAKKYVVSTTLEDVGWNTKLVNGDLEQAILDLKAQPGDGLFVGGVTLPLALVERGLIDEFEFLIHPRIVGHGPSLFSGLSKHVDLELVDHSTMASGAIVATYVPR
ncbi:MAG: dihydrofolate reductase family protein [Candidatus Nanopelagicales bacterium]